MILIAGGAGYIGSHTNKLLSRNGFQTVVFDNLSTGHREFVKWGEFHQGDLGDKDRIRSCFRKFPIDAVMHFSAFAYVGESTAQPARYYRNNVANTLNLLEVMREFSVNHFIFSSSCTVYGDPIHIPIDEDHPREPVSPYGRTKFMVEDILKELDRAYGLKHVNLRYFNAAGADPEGEIGERHDPEPHLIPLVIFAALGINRDIKIFGKDYPTRDGTCIRDYIHVNDLAEAHIRALEHLASTGKSDSFNLGNGSGYSVAEVIDGVRELSGKNIEVTVTERRPGDPAELVSDSRKAERLLDWTPRYPDLRTILATAWDWHSRESAG